MRLHARGSSRVGFLHATERMLGEESLHRHVELIYLTVTDDHSSSVVERKKKYVASIPVANFYIVIWHARPFLGEKSYRGRAETLPVPLREMFQTEGAKGWRRTVSYRWAKCLHQGTYDI